MSGDPGYVPTEEDHAETFDEAHGGCEACGEQLCTGDLEACDGGCVVDAPVPGFTYDGHHFCAGPCADDARATLAVDIMTGRLCTLCDHLLDGPGTKHPTCAERLANAFGYQAGARGGGASS